MMSDHNLPIETIERIFQLGCEQLPEEWYGWKKVPISKRLKHPFIASVAPVCCSWNDLTKRKPNDHYYFTHIALHYERGSVAGDDTFMSTFLEYRRGLAISDGSYLFVRWYITEAYPGQGVRSLASRLFIHGMHMLLEYQDRLRYLETHLWAVEPLAYFNLLASFLSDAHSLTWRLRLHGSCFPTLLSDETSSLYLDPELSNSFEPQTRQDLEFEINANGAFGGDIATAIKSISFSDGQVDGQVLNCIVKRCFNLSHLEFSGMYFSVKKSKDLGVYTSTHNTGDNIMHVSPRSISFASMSSYHINTLLCELDFPNLWLVKVVNYVHPGIEEGFEIVLPPSVSNVECVDSFNGLDAFLFKGTPASSLSATLINNNEFVYSFDMLTVNGHSEHKWTLSISMHPRTNVDFLTQYKLRYLEVRNECIELYE